jgi:hypothetical protein
MTVLKLVGMQNGWLIMVLMMVGHTEAANIQLAWDPPPVQVMGYKLYYGQNSRDYSKIVDVGSQTSYTLSGLQGDQDYYITVTAYDDMGNESPFADEVSAFFTTANSALREPITPDAIRPAAEVARSNGDEGATQHRTASHRSDMPAFMNSTLPHLASEQIESGEISVDHQWRRVEFRKAFVDPIVVARPRGDQQADPAAIGIRGVNAEGFELRLRSWGDRETIPPAETIGYLAIERGEYVLPNGILLEAGTVELERADSAHDVAFSQRFAAVPVVITSISEAPEAEVVNNRLVMIGKHGFRSLIETASQDQHAATPVSIDYIAWEPSRGGIDGLTFEIDRFDHQTDDASQTILFQQLFEETPVFLADLQELGTGSALVVCWDSKNVERVEVSVIPSDASTTETVRRDLQVGYIAVRETVLD